MEEQSKEDLHKELYEEINLLNIKTSLALLETIELYPDSRLREGIEFFIKKFKEELKTKDIKNDKT